jgi:hypothetical protein
MLSTKLVLILVATIFAVAQGEKLNETKTSSLKESDTTKLNDEVIKRYQDINQAFGKYTGAMYGKRYQDINQAFGQYSGPMIGKKSVKESDEVIKRYQDINQAFGQYSGPMIGKRFQSEDKSEDSIKSTKAIKQVFGQYSGPLVGDIKIVNPIVNKSKESVASKRYLQINRAHGTYAGSYVSPTDVTYETCLSLAKVNLFTPTYTSVVSKPVVYSSVPVTVGGLYTGDMYGKRSTADVIQSCKQKYPNLPITSVSNVITPYVSTNTNTNYNSNVYSSDWKGLFSVFDSFPYIFGKRDVADME